MSIESVSCWDTSVATVLIEHFLFRFHKLLKELDVVVLLLLLVAATIRAGVRNRHPGAVFVKLLDSSKITPFALSQLAHAISTFCRNGNRRQSITNTIPRLIASVDGRIHSGGFRRSQMCSSPGLPLGRVQGFPLCARSHI